MFWHSISKKLDTKNYLLWCQQVELIIKGHQLHHFLVSPIIPLKFHTVEDRDVGCVSEEFLTWKQQYQLLLSWLQYSIFGEMLPRVIDCMSVWSLREKIHAFFNSHANVSTQQLRNKLSNTTLEGRSISKYFLQMQCLVDALSTTDEPIFAKEHLDIVLKGLLKDYESIVALLSVVSLIRLPLKKLRHFS
uniref:Retrovirus-related Pol polyprotein from transposon TNT 1-94 n=1 Tax=Cajanus cajan TaxID=3821 RepID=A0A151TND1_CAJCA|nr:hypothetical protein KK1_022183 [Cajanus cajan]